MDVNFQKGTEAIQNKDWISAVYYFSESIKIKASSYAYNERGYSYRELGKLELAKKDYLVVINDLETYKQKAEQNNLETNDEIYENLFFAKMSVASINIELGNLDFIAESEKLCTEIINEFFKIKKPSLNFKNEMVETFCNRAMFRKWLENDDGAIYDYAIAYLNTNIESKKKEILESAKFLHIEENVKSIIEYYDENKLAFWSPFSHFIIILSQESKIVNFNDWQDFFKELYPSVKIIKKNLINIQFSVCETYKIEFEIKHIHFPGARWLDIVFHSTLFISKDLFYLIIKVGDKHLIHGPITVARINYHLFINFNSGQFQSTKNNSIYTWRKDDLDNYYLLVTSNRELSIDNVLFETSIKELSEKR